MLDRLDEPSLPAREILLDFTLILRQSCDLHHGSPPGRNTHAAD